ncbi:PD-(D/E)XK nuclease family protein, partial [Streptomyces sp. NPDC047123]|uniref:PD-(D/E)XK nuclease family protein n=1 Tax=Streptomyces sp. NPDC047123 TaxID=3155622 RepID=UPI0033E5840A
PPDARPHPADPHPADPYPADPQPADPYPADPVPVGAPHRAAHGDDGTRLTPEEARTLASWDRDLGALTDELLRAREAVRDIPVPPSLTASELMRLAADPDGFARDLARPMPRPPQPAARRGTRFHAWIESRFEELTLPMLDPEDLPGGARDEAEIADERDLESLKEAFERTEYAHRAPHRVEVPFQFVIAGRVIRGRIDAVYKDGEGPGAMYEIVDWKTSRTRTADPLQLAVYRLAWAEQQGVPLESVRAAFLYVRSGETARPRNLPDRAGLERLLLEDPAAEPAGEPPGDEPPGEPAPDGG